MITFQNKLDVLIKEGSSFSREEILFLKKEYGKISKSVDPYKSFIRSLESTIQKCIVESTSIYHLSFSIRAKSRNYIYGNSPLNTLYDIASITKLFTLALIYQLEKKNIFSYEDKIIDTLPLSTSMKDITVLDLLKMKGELRTTGKLSETTTKEEFMKCLYTVHPIETSKKGMYTDIGFTLLRFFVEKRLEEKTGEKRRYDTIMEEYILKPFKLFHTFFHPDPSKYILLGNGNRDGVCHDRKSRVIDSINGAAGLFISLGDMDRFIDALLEYKIFSPSFIKEIFSYSFLDTNERKRSYAGIYLPCSSTISSYASKWYSNFTFAHQGYTGSVIMVDMKNHIRNSILVDAMKIGEFEKGEKFLEEYRKIHKYISLYSVIFYLLYE